MAFFGQEWFHQAEATSGPTNPKYRTSRSVAARLAGAEGLMRLMTAHRLDVLIAPTTGPTWLADAKQPKAEVDMGSIAMFPAVAGYPHITVPMGQVHGLPVGLSFIGPPWSEARLIGAAFAYEQHSHKRRTPTYAQPAH
jgi:amidase